MSEAIEVKTEKRTTSAEIKKQIEAAQKAENNAQKKTELVQSGLPISVVADRINAISRTDQAPSASKSEPAQQPAEPATEKETAQSVELKEWKKKKGINWDTPDSVALELRRLDQEFHRKKAEEKKREAVERPAVPAWTPPPAYTPPPQNASYPAYTPPPRQLVENLARQYNMTPEDFERITAVQRDFTGAMLQAERQRHEKELEDMRRENIKNSEFRELSADPVFRNEEVMIEFHNALERAQMENPDSFSQDPYAYRKVYDQALQNIVRRRILERSDGSEIQGNGFQLPKNPPKPTGSAGTGRMTNENSLSMAEFDRLSVDDKRKYMDRMGLVQPKY